ncbi:Nitronate monooxygenase-domain-containing protein [Epithele typhae]|uniref:Nitronate monooxygenase-domain-containing protein n=1 Tax=Epithele typhae TaxID=378194 RepID=UPI002008316C|nr:Nitronate monooxygenase-domain-containing protein [Epithele typhae]KAH9918939.1 Nitronate monooxygenase-domain-containing protein [Epithele typhae]
MGTGTHWKRQPREVQKRLLHMRLSVGFFGVEGTRPWSVSEELLHTHIDLNYQALQISILKITKPALFTHYVSRAEILKFTLGEEPSVASYSQRRQQIVKTNLTSLVGACVPIVSAAMAAHSPPAFDAPEKLKAARASFPGLAHTAPTPIGVGFISWLLDTDEARGRALLAAALASNVAARAGNESGGHGGAAAPPTSTLVSEVLAKLGPSGSPDLAAGGLATGAQIASYLTLGAAGVVLGTRYVLTPESAYPADGKARLLRAAGTDTARTLTRVAGGP